MFGLSTLLLELARLDVDVGTLRYFISYSTLESQLFSPSISSYLEDCKYSPERAKHVTRVYLVSLIFTRDTYHYTYCNYRTRGVHCVLLWRGEKGFCLELCLIPIY